MTLSTIKVDLTKLLLASNCLTSLSEDISLLPALTVLDVSFQLFRFFLIRKMIRMMQIIIFFTTVPDRKGLLFYESFHTVLL